MGSGELIVYTIDVESDIQLSARLLCITVLLACYMHRILVLFNLLQLGTDRVRQSSDEPKLAA